MSIKIHTLNFLLSLKTFSLNQIGIISTFIEKWELKPGILFAIKSNKNSSNKLSIFDLSPNLLH